MNILTLTEDERQQVLSDAAQIVAKELEPLLATPKQAAAMLKCQVRGLKRVGLPKIQLPGQRDKYAVADIHAAIAAGRVR